MYTYDIIKQICKQRSISMQELCEEAGVSQSTFGKWKGDNIKSPGVKAVTRIAEVLGVSPVELLLSDVSANPTDNLYLRDGKPVVRINDKLEILVTELGIDVKEFAARIKADQRSVYRWLKGTQVPMLSTLVTMSEFLIVPLYVLADNTLALQCVPYDYEEQKGSSPDYITYNVRILMFLQHTTVSKLCVYHGYPTRVFYEILNGEPVRHVAWLQRFSEMFSVSIKDLLTDMTTSDRYQGIFKAMDVLERMKFMMALKGVTPAYIADTFGYPKNIFSSHKKMPVEMYYIMGKYFQCPKEWFTRETITLTPGQSLITNWNQII